MSGFVIFALVLTFVYVVYFAVMITLDLHGKKDEKKTEEETYDVGDLTNEEQPVAIEERNEGPDEGDMTFTEQSRMMDSELSTRQETYPIRNLLLVKSNRSSHSHIP